jgi:hypothetical protein
MYSHLILKLTIDSTRYQRHKKEVKFKHGNQVYIDSTREHTDTLRINRFGIE